MDVRLEHADPRAAAALGLVMIIGTLWEVVVNPGDIKLWKGLLPKDDKTLKGEHAILFALSWRGQKIRMANAARAKRLYRIPSG